MCGFASLIFSYELCTIGTYNPDDMLQGFGGSSPQLNVTLKSDE